MNSLISFKAVRGVVSELCAWPFCLEAVTEFPCLPPVMGQGNNSHLTFSSFWLMFKGGCTTMGMAYFSENITFITSTVRETVSPWQWNFKGN